MFKKTLDDPQYDKIESLATSFQRTGRTGFWSQLVLGTFPVAVMIFVFFFSGTLSGTRSGVPIVEWLTLANILILFFTTFWFHRYRALGRRIADPATRPSAEEVAGKVWTGLVASSLGVLFSILVMLFDVGQIFFYFLTAPQGGVPAIQLDGATFVSAIDPGEEEGAGARTPAQPGFLGPEFGTQDPGLDAAANGFGSDRRGLAGGQGGDRLAFRQQPLSDMLHLAPQEDGQSQHHEKDKEPFPSRSGPCHELAETTGPPLQEYKQKGCYQKGQPASPRIGEQEAFQHGGQQQEPQQAACPDPRAIRRGTPECLPASQQTQHPQSSEHAESQRRQTSVVALGEIGGIQPLPIYLEQGAQGETEKGKQEQAANPPGISAGPIGEGDEKQELEPILGTFRRGLGPFRIRRGQSGGQAMANDVKTEGQGH